MGTKNPASKHDFEEPLKTDGMLSESIDKGMTFNDIYEVMSDNTQRGGMGNAILCKSKIDKKYYVLKTYQSSENKELFKKEIEFALKLEKNPYVVYTQTAFQEKDKLYMVMELVGKQPNNFEDSWKTIILKDIIRKATKEDAYRYAIEFCRGMEYLNSIGMKSHRDIKPENIFITEDYHIKIADFGLVGLKNSIGTIGYRSPEQARQEETNIQSDIYSFGVVLYEMFNEGINPYNKTKTSLKEEEFILKEYEKEHPSKSCREIIQKCGEKEQRDRYKDFKELEEDLLKEAKKELGKDFEVKEKEIQEMKANDYFYKGLAYQNINLSIQTIKYYDKAIEFDQKFSEAYYARGNAKQKLRQYEEAIKDYDKTIELDQKFSEAYYARGLIKDILGQHEEANNNFEKIIHIENLYNSKAYNQVLDKYSLKDIIKDPNGIQGIDTKTKASILLLVNKIKQDENIIKNCNKAIEIAAENAIGYYNRGEAKYKLERYKEAVKDYDKAIEFDQKFSEAYYARGNAKQKLKQYEEAINDYDKAIEFDQKFLEDRYYKTRLYYNRGEAKYKLERYKEAVKDYDKAIELDQKFSEAYYARGNAKQKLKQYEEAINDYDKAIEFDQKFLEDRYYKTRLYYNRGEAKYKLRRYKEAVKDCDKAIELDYDFMSAYLLKSSIGSILNLKAIKIDAKNIREYYARGNAKQKLKQYEEAINDYDKAIEFDQKFLEAYYARGNAKQKLKQYKEAIKDYDKAIELDQKFSEAYYARGNAKQKLKQYEEAINDYNKTIEIKPMFEKAYTCLTYCYIYMNNKYKALSVIKNALNLNLWTSINAIYINTLGDVYKYIKEYDKAIEQYKKAISLNKNQISSYKSLIEIYKILGKEKEAEKTEKELIKLKEDK